MGCKQIIIIIVIDSVQRIRLQTLLCPSHRQLLYIYHCQWTSNSPKTLCELRSRPVYWHTVYDMRAVQMFLYGWGPTCTHEQLLTFTLHKWRHTHLSWNATIFLAVLDVPPRNIYRHRHIHKIYKASSSLEKSRGGRLLRIGPDNPQWTGDMSIPGVMRDDHKGIDVKGEIVLIGWVTWRIIMMRQIHTFHLGVLYIYTVYIYINHRSSSASWIKHVILTSVSSFSKVWRYKDSELSTMSKLSQRFDVYCLLICALWSPALPSSSLLE